MKIIIKEGQLKKLNESLGVNEAAIEYTNFIYNLLEPVVIQMVAIDEETEEKINVRDKDLLNFIKSDPTTFEELPIGEIEIELM
jgi:transcription antitermination factor NusA-like protein